jgi:hypothetical protein
MDILYKIQGPSKPKRVWFDSDLAIEQGVGVCYNITKVTTNAGETANDPWEARAAFVVRPAAGNKIFFAGVTAKAYAAKVGGQMIEIFEPGSVCMVRCGIATSVGVTYMTCKIGVVDSVYGSFAARGASELGRGVALALQTQADPSGNGAGSKTTLVLSYLQDGTESQLVA